QELKKSQALTGHSSYGQLIHGVQRYYEERQHNDMRLFEFIRKKQNPHTLFITCSDSRIVTSTMTSTNPGELFIVRNVGNYIPPYDTSDMACHSEFAALEFSLTS